MPLYRYEALDPAGKTLRGMVEAESPSAARAKLRKDRVFPVEMAPELPGAASRGRGAAGILPVRRIPAAEIAAFTGQLATLLRAGMPVVRALQALTEQTENPALRTMLAQVRDSVSQGSSLAEAFAAHTAFDALYVDLVRAGEATGSLDNSLTSLASMLASRQRLRRKVQSALAYPILMTLVGSGLLVIMLTYVLPQVVHIFDDLGQNLPWPTRLLLAGAGAFQSGWPLLLAAAVAVGAAAILGLRRPEVRLWLDRIKLKLPVFGPLARKAAMARVSSALGSLLRGGVPLLAALEAASGVAANAAIQRRLQEAAASVRKGTDLAGSLAGDPLIPPVAVHMIRVGEESGSLQDMLFQAAALFEEEVEASVSTLTSLLEPVLILGMGLVIGFMVLAILMPIFQLNQASFG
jgi:general secretion pathway protein F